jgi:WhiB family redox-sensing transcriptional regulator
MSVRQSEPLGAWQHEAACTHAPSDLFFPDSGMEAGPAKAICAGCPVKADCLDHALRNNETRGVWGGKTESERKSIRRMDLKRRAKARANA